MLGRIALVGTIAVTALVVGLAGPAAAQSGAGCSLQGTASFSPGLTGTAGNFNYSFSGALSNCLSSTGPGPAGGGNVEAGKVFTSNGEHFQEPVPSGNGTCQNGTTSGKAIITWQGGDVTIIDYTTTSAAAAVVLQGDVIGSLTIPAINPQTGQPTSYTLHTTRWSGASALGLLAFQPSDPTACNGSGVTSAGITGFTGVGSE